MTFNSRIKHYKKYSFGEDKTDNIIIQGDNKDVLDCISDKYKEKIKCVYIDPPYNNGENYLHFSDDEEHETWLSEITNVLHKLKPFLSKDGSVWISIDDSEMHYLKVAADKVFGRKNFVTTIIWQQRSTRENRKVFSNNHEYILVYARNPDIFKKSRNLLPYTKEALKRYKNYDEDIRGVWQSISANVQAGHATKSQFYELVAPNGKVHIPPNGRCWVYNEKRMKEEIKKNNIWFGKDGNNVPRIKSFLNNSKKGLTPETLWLSDFAETNKSAKKHLLKLFPDNLPFDTPKPEKLIKNILHIATDENDYVLDCFLGSGSTTSVAHKMNRKYIGVEIGNHITEYAVNRLRKVIDGEKNGISKEINWKGGGGFKFYKYR